MKKFLILLLPMCLTACNASEESPAEQQAIQENQQCSFRTTAEAISIANEAGKALPSISRSVKTVDKVYVIGNSHSRSTSAEPVLYAVDYSNNEGFALISANRACEPLLALIEEGSFYDEQTQSNEPFQTTMGNIMAYSINPGGNPGDNGPITIMPGFKIDTTYSTEIYGPRVQVAWNQGWPENKYAPNSLAGCGPVAMAQMLSYYETPSTLPITFSGAPVSSVQLDWNAMRKHSRSYQNYDHYSCQASEQAHEMISLLVRQMGELAGSVYNPIDNVVDKGTSTRDLPMEVALRSLLPSKRHCPGNGDERLFYWVSQKNIATVSGNAYSEDGHTKEASHIWLADGAMRRTTTITYREPEMNEITGQIEYNATQVRNYVSKYIHYNWGWGGSCNGYFKEGIFNPTMGSQYDQHGNPSASYNDTYITTYVYYADPDQVDF